jgi:predicted RNA binding protein YcfA (HicA-like mRNA interferase family)
MKVRDIIRAMEVKGWRMEKRTATGHRKFSHPTKPGKVPFQVSWVKTFRPELSRR